VLQHSVTLGDIFQVLCSLVCYNRLQKDFIAPILSRILQSAPMQVVDTLHLCLLECSQTVLKDITIPQATVVIVIAVVMEQ
jgi:uncharacterized protein (DUF2384 family)